MEIQIRKATKADLASVLELVKELAVYEKAENEVITTLEDYENAFGKGDFGSHLAVYNGQVIGMVLYFINFSTWKGRMLYLEDFVVKEQYRRTGAGQLLFDAFLQEARDLGCILTKWQVLDWNEPALNFYKKNNAIIEEEWFNGKIFIK